MNCIVNNTLLIGPLRNILIITKYVQYVCISQKNALRVLRYNHALILLKVLTKTRHLLKNSFTEKCKLI